RPLESELAAIARLHTTADLPLAFSHAAEIGRLAPIAATVTQDPKNSSVYVVSIGQYLLGLPDRDYYLRQDERFTAIRKAYTAYIAQLFTLAGQPDPPGAAQRILALETRLAEQQWDRARNRDRNATYNKMTVAQLSA